MIVRVRYQVAISGMRSRVDIDRFELAVLLVAALVCVVYEIRCPVASTAPEPAQAAVGR